MPSSKTFGFYTTVASISMIVILTIILRFSNLSGTYFHPDEEITTGVVSNMHASGSLNTNWKHANLISLFNYNQYNFSSYMYASLAFYTAYRNSGDFLNGRWNNEETKYSLRLFSAILGTFGGILVFLAARRLLGVNEALSALLFYGVAPVLVQDAHLARPETFLTVLTLIILLACAPAKQMTAKRLGLACFVVGFAMSCKVSAVLLFPIPFYGAFCLFRTAYEAKDGSTWRKVIPSLILCAIVGLVGFITGVPYAIADPGGYLEGFDYLRNQYSGPHYPITPFGAANAYFTISRYFFETFGAIFTVFFFLGLMRLLVQNNVRTIVVLVLPLLFCFLVFGAEQTFFARNFSHVVPFISIIAAAGAYFAVSVTYGFIGQQRSLTRSLLFVFVCGATVLHPLAISKAMVFGVMSGSFEKDLGAYRKRFEQSHKGTLVTRCAPFGNCDLSGIIEASDPFILEISDYNDSRSQNIISYLKEVTKTEEIGLFPTLFPGMSPNTINFRWSPTVRFFRVTPISQSEIDNGLFESESEWKISRGWRKNGMYPADMPPTSLADYAYGSITEEADSTGLIKSKPFLLGANETLLLYIKYGPLSSSQSIRLVSDDDDSTSHECPKDMPYHVWIPCILPTAAETDKKMWVIEATDNGTRVGAWSAIAHPLVLNRR